PSAVANYYLTGHIYLVRDTGVSRYHNRLPPGTNLATSDHRLETITLGDRRDALRAACPRIPASAPLYIVLSVADTANNGWGLIEAGFAAFQYLAQARILGLGGCLTAPLTMAERSSIRTALGLPSSEHPAIVFSTGSVLTGVGDRNKPGVARLRAWPGLPVRIDYSLRQADDVRFTVTDLTGRRVCEWQEAGRVGNQSTWWSGQDRGGRTVPAGVYVVCLTAGKETERCRVVVVR
ncbi:MAG: nitroreductase family protein, partial [candidate division WOR-3 bacterium]